LPKYLLDECVIRSMDSHKNVVKWKRSVSDHDLAICVLTMWEKRRGIEAQRKNNPKLVETKLKAIAVFEDSFGDRLLSLDPAAAREWATFVGRQDKHRMDAGIAAIAKRHGLTMVTRNLTDFEKFRVACLDPFRDPPLLVTYG